MYTVCFSNEKGGVGKTTLSTNIAYLLAYYGGRVLFIDNDRQGNATEFFGVKTDNLPTVTEILTEQADIKNVVQHTRYEGLDLIPSDQSLTRANLNLLLLKEKPQQNILRDALKVLEGNYDFAIIDNPPDHETMSVLNALCASDGVIIVSPTTLYGLAGIKIIKDEIDIIKQYNTALKIDGILLNNFKPTTESFQAINILLNLNLPIFSHKIRHTAGYVDSALHRHQSVFEHCPQCGFARDLKNWLMNYLTGVPSFLA